MGPEKAIDPLKLVLTGVKFPRINSANLDSTLGSLALRHSCKGRSHT